MFLPSPLLDLDLTFAVAVVSFWGMPPPYICALLPFIMPVSYLFESIPVPIANFLIPT